MVNNEELFQNLFNKELGILRGLGEESFATLVHEQDHFFNDLFNGLYTSAKRRFELMFDIMVLEENEEERLKDLYKYFIYIAGAFTDKFTIKFSFRWNIIATSTSLMKVIDRWETEDDYREGMDFIIHTFMNAINSRDTEPSLHPHVLRFMTYVKENIYTNLNLYTISKDLNLSCGHLSRLVNKELNSTIPSYIANKKMEYAAKHLRDTELPISEISEMLGYTSTSYFTTLFKNRFDITPSHYRIKALYEYRL
ncbi:helix-turn-helix transcriptional regulator [Halobacillus karajensis]|uniref:Regulatory protein SoxS n=1 Tax=Halobacillus karajensis TaxID=195088 RepID=A0A024P4F4_9BACI|nr:AraC family transcriptional regulator [Halobacillus karajensis]CDQ20785.1 Regulatory protein SoxS [Halobacillus karajensis]CDQ23745.1 Regulatory protein SoxS [Halobacillus karajensis]CDQ27223.1 Regulatory protein SoxS [Halobacillus karajensis]